MKHPENLSNEQLVNLIRSGENYAFHEFYRRNRTRVMGFARRFFRDQESIKELTQEIFVKFWENREKLDPAKNPESLLFFMVRSTFLDTLKKKAQETNYMEQQLFLEDELDSTDRYMDFKDCAEIISKAIETLPKQAKIIYQLSRNYGWSHEKISGHMQISKKTVNNQITKSTRHIRRYFTRLSPETALGLVSLFSLFI